MIHNVFPDKAKKDLPGPNSGTGRSFLTENMSRIIIYPPAFYLKVLIES